MRCCENCTSLRFTTMSYTHIPVTLTLDVHNSISAIRTET
jgi:hypothetical protein